MSVASPTCTHTISAGTSSAYWIAPTAPGSPAARRSRADRGAGRPRARGGGAAGRRRRRPRCRARWRSRRAGGSPSRAVSLPLHSSRSIVSPVPPPPACGPAAVATVPKKIVSAPSASSPRTAHTPRRSSDARPLPRLVARAPRERDGRDEDQHREREVAHHEAGREVVADGEAAEHRLADDAEREQHAEHREVAAERPPPERERARGDRGQPDEAGDHAVAVLDPRVRLERRGDAAVALRPVRAPEPGAGQPHRRAGEDDQREGRERDLRDALVGARGERRGCACERQASHAGARPRPRVGAPGTGRRASQAPCASRPLRRRGARAG